MDFCTETLGTKISILDDKVAEEGFEVSNLLKSKYITGNHLISTSEGFMVALFIRPPVTLRFDFSIPIHISHIEIKPKLGQQVSTAFKIETIIEQTTDSESKYQIGREFLDGSSSSFPTMIVFKNPRFSLINRLRNLPLIQFEGGRNFSGSFDLRHPTYNSCERVFSLLLTIERAIRPSQLAVLESICIWGQPSKWSSPELANSLTAKWRTFVQPRDVKVNDNAEDVHPPAKRICPMESNNDTIPEEFLDPITLEILCQPVRLPCGVAIDATTLEKYLAEEQKWGRLENDPYTGRAFTQNSQPIADLSLKARLDSFLTTQANQIGRLQNIPRTVGTLKSRISPSESQMVPKLLGYPSATTEIDSCSANDILVPSSSKLSKNELIDQELARILNRDVSEVSKKIDEDCCLCKVSLSNPISEKSRITFYRSSCSHSLICRNCLLNELQSIECRSCRLVLQRKDWSKVFV